MIGTAAEIREELGWACRRRLSTLRSVDAGVSRSMSQLTVIRNLEEALRVAESREANHATMTPNPSE